MSPLGTQKWGFSEALCSFQSGGQSWHNLRLHQYWAFIKFKLRYFEDMIILSFLCFWIGEEQVIIEENRNIFT